jgi:hypothetical protein
MEMPAQGKICHEIAAPPGLKMAYDVVSIDEEKALIAEIEAMGLPPFALDPGNPRCTKNVRLGLSLSARGHIGVRAPAFLAARCPGHGR